MKKLIFTTLLFVFLLSIPVNAKGIDYKDVDCYYGMIPYGVRNLVESNGFDYYIVNNLGPSEGFSYSIRALTIISEKEILIDNRKGCEKDIIHEVMHVVDYFYDWGLGEGIEPIRLQEVSNFVKYVDPSTHRNNVSSDYEYLAESFEMYVLKPADLKLWCPQTYLYLDNIVNSLEVPNA